MSIIWSGLALVMLAVLVVDGGGGGGGVVHRRGPPARRHEVKLLRGLAAAKQMRLSPQPDRQTRSAVIGPRVRATNFQPHVQAAAHARRQENSPRQTATSQSLTPPGMP